MIELTRAMKHIFFVFLLFPILCLAQAPQKLNYQSIVRDNGGTPLANQNVRFRMSILEGSIGGTTIYSETHQVTTNDFGSVSFLIGSGQIVQGSFENIDWGSDDHFLKTEMDESGGTNYTAMGTTQMVSVPYALYAEKAGSSGDGKTYISFFGDMDNASAQLLIESELGPNTQVVHAHETSELTTISMENLDKLEYVRINSNSALDNVSFENLQTLTSYYDFVSQIQNNPVLSTLDLSSLEFIQGRLEIEGNALSHLNLSSLSFARVLIIREPLATSIDLSNLEVCRNLIIKDNPNLSTLSLQSIDFSECIGSIKLSGNAFTSSVVNDFLTQLVSANVTGLNIELEDQNPPAPPTGQGLVDKQTLIDNGNTVTTD